MTTPKPSVFLSSTKETTIKNKKESRKSIIPNLLGQNSIARRTNPKIPIRTVTSFVDLGPAGKSLETPHSRKRDDSQGPLKTNNHHHIVLDSQNQSFNIPVFTNKKEIKLPKPSAFKTGDIGIVKTFIHLGRLGQGEKKVFTRSVKKSQQGKRRLKIRRKVKKGGNTTDKRQNQ